MLFSCHPSPDIKGSDSTEIDIMGTPIQEMTDEIDPISISLDAGDFEIIPKATYAISAEVVGAKTYSRGWEAKLAPVDLALIWGELTRENLKKELNFSQSNRWYYYRYSAAFPRSKKFIIHHSANCHMIPSTDNIKRALYQVRIGDRVKIDGFLVQIRGRKGQQKYWWNSSLSRKDTGNHSCELIYVLDLRVNEHIY